jgi:hypothetical protein
LIGVLIFGLFVGLIGALFVGLFRLFTSDAIPETRSAVNEGTHRSIRMASMSLLIFGLVVGLSRGLYGGLFFGLYGVLIFGLSGGLISGGINALKHFVLRLFLWKSGQMWLLKRRYRTRVH